MLLVHDLSGSGARNVSGFWVTYGNTHKPGALVPGDADDEIRRGLRGLEGQAHPQFVWRRFRGPRKLPIDYAEDNSTRTGHETGRLKTPPERRTPLLDPGPSGTWLSKHV